MLLPVLLVVLPILISALIEPRPQAIGGPVIKAKIPGSSVPVIAKGLLTDVKKAPVGDKRVPVDFKQEPVDVKQEPIKHEAEIKQEPTKPQKQQETAKPTLYTSQGYVVRILKAMPTAGAKNDPKADPKSDPKPSPKTDPPAPQPVAPRSSEYIIRRPQSTIYQIDPPRPTTTVPAPKPIPEITATPPKIPASSKPTPGPVKKGEEEGEEGEEGGEGEPGKKGATTTVQSGDPWGDFVFPTRGPRPKWMSNAANSMHSGHLLVLGSVILVAWLI